MRHGSGYLWALAVVLGAQWPGALNAQQAPAPAKPAAAKPAAIEMDTQLVSDIFECVSPGLTKEWSRAWIVLTPVGSYDTYLAELFVAASPTDRKGQPLLTPCGAPQFGEFVRRLNEYLTPAQKKWRSASITFLREGKFEVKFDKP